MEPGPDALPAVETLLARHGVTGYFPTTVTAPLDTLLAALDRLGAAIQAASTTPQREDKAHPLGIHLEGPFLSHDYRDLVKRSDVLTFDTAPLAADTEITGPIHARIFFSCDCRDTDLWVRLLDVSPDGTAFNLMTSSNEIIAVHVKQPIALDAAHPTNDWRRATPISFCHDWQGKNPDPDRETTVRVLWSPETLYLRFECRYRELHVQCGFHEVNTLLSAVVARFANAGRIVAVIGFVGHRAAKLSRRIDLHMRRVELGLEFAQETLAFFIQSSIGLGGGRSGSGFDGRNFRGDPFIGAANWARRDVCRVVRAALSAGQAVAYGLENDGRSLSGLRRRGFGYGSARFGGNWSTSRSRCGARS